MLPRSVESKVEQYLNRICSAPRGAQPGQRGERLGDRLRRRHGARFQRHHHGLRVAGMDPFLGHADQLHRRHAVAHQHAGKVRGAGEVVRDAAEQDRHFQGLVWLPPGPF